MYYVSRYLKMDHFLDDTISGIQKLAAYVKATGGLAVHTNKAQFGASDWAVQELEKTPMHPSVKNSFGLMLCFLWAKLWK